jgi:uncharacterized ferritin-like protein (DUF455 family)
VTPDWSPFSLVAREERADPPRLISTPQGVGDRLRAAAFAELQAREAFEWAARTYDDAPEELRGAWHTLAQAEERHLNWLLSRAAALGVDLRERKVSDQLWVSLTRCKSAREFAIYMAEAEDRGRKAGERFAVAMKEADPESARIFGQIALEERSHIELAERFFPRETTHELRA